MRLENMQTQHGNIQKPGMMLFLGNYCCTVTAIRNMQVNGGVRWVFTLHVGNAVDRKSSIILQINTSVYVQRSQHSRTAPNKQYECIEL